MITALQLWLAPLLGAVLTLWAAVIALGAAAYTPLPRMLARSSRDAAGGPSVPRQLHLIRFTLLVFAGAMAATAVGWWAGGAARGLPRYLLAVLLVWLVGDLLPRVLAAIAPDLVRAVQGTARFSLRLFAPVLRLTAWVARRTRAVERRVPGVAQAVDDREMLHGVFSLQEMTVAEVMTPRIDIVSVDLADPRDAVVATLRRSGHSRLLATDGDPDTVVGVLYAKDLLPRSDGAVRDWPALVRPAAFVPEAKPLAAQLRDFQRGPSHMAVVVDEFGGTAGLVTLEDVLEQIVGEIHDEYDAGEPEPISPHGPGRWLVQGGIPLVELEAHLEYTFEREDVDTVGGLVLAALGHVPRVGEHLDLGAYRFTVDQVVRRRVARVVVEALAPAAADGEAPA